MQLLQQRQTHGDDGESNLATYACTSDYCWKALESEMRNEWLVLAGRVPAIGNRQARSRGRRDAMTAIASNNTEHRRRSSTGRVPVVVARPTSSNNVVLLTAANGHSRSSHRKRAGGTTECATDNIFCLLSFFVTAGHRIAPELGPGP